MLAAIRVCDLNLPENLDRNNWVLFSTKLRAVIYEKEKVIKNQQHLETIQSKGHKLFLKSRSNFYKHVIARVEQNDDPKVIFDSSSQKLIDDPTDVKKTIQKEAAKILTKGKKLPVVLPRWAAKFYQHNALQTKPALWKPLSKSITQTEFLEILNTESKTPGTDKISKDLLKRIIYVDGHPNVTITDHFIKLFNDWYEKPCVPKNASEAWIKLINKPSKDPLITQTNAQ